MIVPLLDETTHDAERVVNGTLAFVEHELAAAHREDADGATPVLHARNLDNFCPVGVGLVDEIIYIRKVKTKKGGVKEIGRT